MTLFTSFSSSLYPEILRVSGMMPNHGYGDLDRLRHRSPSPMASSNLMSNVAGTGIGGWNGLPQEVFFLLGLIYLKSVLLQFFFFAHWANIFFSFFIFSPPECFDPDILWLCYVSTSEGKGFRYLDY